MKICLIGRFEKMHDEGFKNVFFQLYEGLKPNHDILTLDVRDVPKNIATIKKFNPEIIHQVAGPSPLAFVSLKLIKSICKNSKSVLSAIHSAHLYSEVYKTAVQISSKIFRPDLILIQSRKSESMFGAKVAFLPNGVDIEKFVPVSDNKKVDLREKYGISKDKFVILHIGHLIEVRNLNFLSELQKDDGNQVIVVGSPHREPDKDVYEILNKCGCIVWRKYFDNIEEVYQLADCYIFPVKKGYTLLMPLTVMEAMTCNLPVVSTDFDGLVESFESGKGLFFARETAEFLRYVQRIKQGEVGTIETRDKVMPYSWDRWIKKLEGLYEEITER